MSLNSLQYENKKKFISGFYDNFINSNEREQYSLLNEMVKNVEMKNSIDFYRPALNSVCSLSNLFFRFHTTTLTEACSNELKQHHL